MHLSNGTLLQGGKYKIEKKLGQGGFGITYLATQVLLERKVCIKEFFYKEYCERDATTSNVTLGTKSSRELVDKFMKKFIKEASTISRLDHRNIIRIHDIFTENNTAYYVMEYHSGGSLGDLVKSRGVLPESDAVRYITQIAEAVGYIHERNINHLDIKPANILLNSEGASVLIDFGLSKQYDEQGSQTSSTPVGISHGYAPMEQYNPGGVSTFTPQSDIYSLGATLYKLVTGDTPPKASEILNDGLPALPAHLSAGVRKAIEQAMQPRKKDRPATVKEFLALLSSTVASEKNRDPEITVVIEPEEKPKKRTTKKKETNNPDSTLVIGTKKTVKKEEPKKVAKIPVPSDAEFCDGLAAVESNGKWGYIDKNGNIIVPFKYESASLFLEKLAAVKLRGKWGFIDKQDNLVIPLKYEDAWSFFEGLATVKLKGKYGFINKDGNVVIPLKYDDAEPFSEGLAAVEVNGKWGVIDKSDNLVIPFKYDYVGDFSNGRAEFELNGRKGYIDKYGTEHYDNGGSAPKKNVTYNVAKFSVPAKAIFYDGLAVVESNDSGWACDVKKGYIDKNGSVIIPFKYEDAWSFSEGLAAVKLNGKWGFIDKNGNVVIPFTYNYAWSFCAGLARVNLCGEWGFIDKSNNVVIPFKYDYVWDFSNGRAEFELNGRKGYLDKYGKEYNNDGGYIPSTPSAKVENKQTVATDDIEEEWSIRKSSFCKWVSLIIILILFILSLITGIYEEFDKSILSGFFTVLLAAWMIIFD